MNLSTTRPTLRRTRAAAGLSALVLAASLSACSGDDDSESPEGDSGSEDGAASAEGGSDAEDGSGEEATDAPVGDISQKCKATVEVTGAVTLSWERKGEVVIAADQAEGSGPAAFYQSTNPNGKSMVLLYSAGDGFKPSVVLSSGGSNFSTGSTDASGLDAAEDGSKVEAKGVKLTDTQGRNATVDASFTCGEDVGKKNG